MPVCLYMHICISCLSVSVELLFTMFHYGRGRAQISLCLFSVSNQLNLFPMGENSQQYDSIACFNNQCRKQAVVVVWDFLLNHAVYLTFLLNIIRLITNTLCICCIKCWCPCSLLQYSDKI